MKKFLKPVKATLISAGLSVLSLGVFGQALAQKFPVKPVEWVVPYPAGGGTDVIARTLADGIQKRGNINFVVTNKPGAATIIGAEYVAKSKPDGYVVMSADTATLAANEFLYSKLPYSPKKDFSDLGLICRFNLILVVNPKIPAKNLKEFIAWAKTQKDAIPYGSPGQGSPHHLATELFKAETGLNLTHVPYKGAAPAIQDVVGGQIPFMFVDSAAGYGHIVAGTLRPIALANTKRISTLPDIQTFNEQGLKGFEAYAWQGLVGPAGLSESVSALFNQELRAVLDSTMVKAKFQALGVEPMPSTVAEMTKYVEAERAKWGKLIKANNIKLD